MRWWSFDPRPPLSPPHRRANPAPRRRQPVHARLRVGWRLRRRRGRRERQRSSASTPPGGHLPSLSTLRAGTADTGPSAWRHPCALGVRPRGGHRRAANVPGHRSARATLLGASVGRPSGSSCASPRAPPCAALHSSSGVCTASPRKSKHSNERHAGCARTMTLGGEAPPPSSRCRARRLPDDGGGRGGRAGPVRTSASPARFLATRHAVRCRRRRPS
jgi:hypothetical protein